MSTRVLIADTDQSLLNSYRECFARNGFEVATAVSGLDCVAKLRRFNPDVMVLELDMPWGGGVGVLALMHEGYNVPPVPVMVLTARRDLRDLDDVLLFEMVSDYHVKPLGPEQLVRTIRRLLEDPPRPFEFWESASERRKRRSPGHPTKHPTDATPVLCASADEADEVEP